jgi:hypothetical protein
MNAYTHAHTHIHTYKQTNKQTNIHTYKHTYIRRGEAWYSRLCAARCMHIHTQLCTYTHTYTYIHINTHTHTQNHVYSPYSCPIARSGGCCHPTAPYITSSFLTAMLDAEGLPFGTVLCVPVDLCLIMMLDCQSGSEGLAARDNLLKN